MSRLVERRVAGVCAGAVIDFMCEQKSEKEDKREKGGWRKADEIKIGDKKDERDEVKDKKRARTAEKETERRSLRRHTATPFLHDSIGQSLCCGWKT